jgi:hypothetical protein
MISKHKTVFEAFLILTSNLDVGGGGQLSTARIILPPMDRAHRTHWLGPRAGLDSMAKRNVFAVVKSPTTLVTHINRPQTTRYTCVTTEVEIITAVATF